LEPGNGISIELPLRRTLLLQNSYELRVKRITQRRWLHRDF